MADQDLLETIDSDENSYASISGERDSSMDIYSPFDVDAEAWSNDTYRWSDFIGQINKLPPASQDIMLDAGTAYFLRDVAESYDLNDEQIKNLSRIVRDTLLGALAKEEMQSNISNQLNLSPEDGLAIASSVSSELFKFKTERPDLKIAPNTNRNNVVNLRNQ